MTEIDFIQPKKTVGKLISIDVLDKIRAEIGNLQTFDTEIIYGLIDTTVELREVFRIIDKYRTESEE